MRQPLLLASLAILLGVALPAMGDDKNGLSLTVAKKTLERNDQRGSFYYDRIDRTQGLKITLKNTSFQEEPAGEVNWTLLVRKYYSNVVEGYRGKVELKAMKPAETVEMVIGAAEIQGWADIGGQAKDKLEHQIVVTQGGKETNRVTSTSVFDSIAERATYRSTKKQDPQ